MHIIAMMGTQNTFLYPITKTTINGRNVPSVTYEHSGKSGTFTQGANKQWTESTIEGNKFSFKETGEMNGRYIWMMLAVTMSKYN